MKRRFFYLLPVLIGVAVLVGGCGTTELLESHLGGFDQNKPWTLLAGAEVKQAKSLAMGSAVTKGWKIADASGRKLLVRRPLSAAAAESVVGEPISKPVIEVRTDFSKRRGGVAVNAAAAVVGDKTTDKGKKAAVRIDVTESYREELNLSLGTLQRSWEENRWRAVAVTQPPPPKDAEEVVSADERPDNRPGATPDEEIATAAPSPPEENTAAPVATSRTDDTAVPSGDGSMPGTTADDLAGEGTTAPIAAPSPGNVAVPSGDGNTPGTMADDLVGEGTAASIAAPSPGDVAVPVEDRTAATLPPSLPHQPAATTPPDSSMPVLSLTERSGMWAFYADNYARRQGCEPSGSGATLEYEYPTFEVHRIHCNNGQNFLLRCNAGTCQRLRQDWVPPPRSQTVPYGILSRGR